MGNKGLGKQKILKNLRKSAQSAGNKKGINADLFAAVFARRFRGLTQIYSLFLRRIKKSAAISVICGKQNLKNKSAAICVICGKQKNSSNIETNMDENDISYKIRGAIYEVYNQLGPGLLESVYESALMYELKKQGLKVQNQVPLPVYYDDVKLEDVGFRLDIIVENKVVIELKSVDVLVAVHHKQLLTYLKLSKLKLGILVNFNCSDITKQIFRKVNGLQIVS